MTDLEKAKMAAASLLERSGITHFAGSQVFADLVEMAKATLRYQQAQSGQSSCGAN
jgi:hypothetical protein